MSKDYYVYISPTVWYEYLQCNECGKQWRHKWDNEDFNNDFTQCPLGCSDFDFDNIAICEYTGNTDT